MPKQTSQTKLGEDGVTVMQLCNRCKEYKPQESGFYPYARKLKAAGCKSCAEARKKVEGQLQKDSAPHRLRARLRRREGSEFDTSISLSDIRYVLEAYDMTCAISQEKLDNKTVTLARFDHDVAITFSNIVVVHKRFGRLHGNKGLAKRPWLPAETDRIQSALTQVKSRVEFK